MSRPAYEHMKSVGYGRIVNTSSGSGYLDHSGKVPTPAKPRSTGSPEHLRSKVYGMGYMSTQSRGALTRMTGTSLVTTETSPTPLASGEIS